MRSLLASLLLLALPASAWEYTAGEAVIAPGPVHAVRAVPMGHREVILAMGATESWIIDPLHGEVVRTLDRGGVDSALVDLDGDGRDELVGCGASGLWSVPWTGRYGGEATDHDLRPCAALVAVDEGALAGLVAAGEGWVGHFAIGAEGPSAGGVPFAPIAGQPLLATDRSRVAYAVVGGEAVYAHGPQGLSQYATGGAIGDLAWARGAWTWTLPEQYAVADHTHREVPLPDARLLLPAGEQLLVVGDGVSTWLTEDEVLAIATPTGVRHAAVAFLAEDDCADVLVSDGKTVTALEGSCELATASLPEAEQEAGEGEEEGPRLRPARVQRRRMVLGVEVPSFLGNRQVTAAERSRAQRYVVVGSGWAMGATIGPTEVQIPFFPALALGYEVGGPHVRGYFGIDSAALFFWLRADGRGGGIHLANATTGLTFGSPTLRVGPFITGGLLNYGAGVRTALTPWTAGGSSKGIEARLTWFGPSTGEVMILYVWSQPLRRARDRWDDGHKEPVRASEDFPELSRISVRAEEPRMRGRTPLCGEFSVGAGAAISASSTVFSWTHVGAGNSVAFGGSPAVALACGTGFAERELGEDGEVRIASRRPLSLHIGMETAPFLRYLVFNGANSGNDHLSHFGTLSLGLSAGTERFHIGPLAVAGIWELGAGARAVIGLHTDRQGLQHRLEIRGWGLYKGAPAGEAFLLYGFAWDPWKDARFGDQVRGR